MKRIGIDIGTTSVSAAVWDDETRQLITARTREHRAGLPSERNGEVIQDPGIIVRYAEELLQELISLYPEVCGIGISTQMHGILYADDNGQAVSPLYTWQNRQEGDEEAARKWRKISNTSVYPGYGLLTVLMHAQNDCIPASAAQISGIGEYFAVKITGRKKAVFDPTMAASLGFYDVRTGSFCKEAMREAGIPERLFPEVCPEHTVFGMYRGIPVMAPLGDNQASFLGTPGTDLYIPLVNIGTGSQVSVLTDTCVRIPGIETRPFPGNRYLLAGSALAGGRAYAAVHDFFASFAEAAGCAETDIYALMEKLGREAEGQADPMIMDTRLSGTREDPGITGSLQNIRIGNLTPGGLVQAVLRGMSEELYTMYETIQKAAGGNTEVILTAGNAVTHNPLLQEILREIFRKEIRIPEVREAAAVGAAMYTVNK